MFTGIIQHVGRVLGVSSTPAGKRLRIDVGPLTSGLAAGASMAVDGACLTAAAIDGAEAAFDAVPETLSRTTLGRLTPGSRVNLEPALSLGGRLDGHLVEGHVDGIAEVARIGTGPAGRTLSFSAPRELTDQMVVKGSVAVAGVSLTLTEVASGRLSVALVPTTLAGTTLGELRVGERCNIELDVIGKYVRRYLEGTAGGGLTLEKLRRAGFA